jgi:hypothetical protein
MVMLTQEIQIFTNGVLKFEADVVSQAASGLFKAEIGFYTDPRAFFCHTIKERVTSIEAFRLIFPIMLLTPESMIR